MDIGPAARFPLAGTPAPRPLPTTDPGLPAPSAAPPEAAPTGQDATLWDILTDEERSFFLARTALGPLTYGRGTGHHDTPSAPVGQRIDVRA